jgi:hypothetical protein
MEEFNQLMLSGYAEAMIALLLCTRLARHHCIIDSFDSVACILVLTRREECWPVVLFFAAALEKYYTILCA